MPPLGRLTKRREFLRVAGGRRKKVMPGVVVQAFQRDPAGTMPPRVGFTVSRKVGRSVERNRARRRLRAAAREVLPAAAESGVDYVIIGRKATLTRDYAALTRDLHAAVRKLNRQHRQEKAGAPAEPASADIPAGSGS